MKIYKTFLILTVILFSQFSFAQSEIETLEKMHRMVMNDRANETKAKELVWNYHTSAKQKVREKSGKLTQAEYDNISNYQKITWNQITNAIREYYGGSYSKFYAQKREFLEEYKEEVLDRLYKYIYK